MEIKRDIFAAPSTLKNVFTFYEDIVLLREVEACNPYENTAKWADVRKRISKVIRRDLSMQNLKNYMDYLITLFQKKDYPNLRKRSSETDYQEKMKLLEKIVNMKTQFENQAKQNTSKNTSVSEQHCVGHSSAFYISSRMEKLEKIQDTESSKISRTVSTGISEVSTNFKHQAANKNCVKKLRNRTEEELDLKRRKLEYKEKKLALEERKLTLEEAKLSFEIQKSSENQNPFNLF